LDGWIRRKLRCYRLKQCQTAKSLVRFLRQLGLAAAPAYRMARPAKVGGGCHSPNRRITPCPRTGSSCRESYP
jgi:hypothetical protein